MTATFDQAKCAQRERLAARRDNVTAVPLQFLMAPPATVAGGLRYAHGSLPATDADALSAINALLPTDAPPLTAEDVYLHYVEAANNRFVSDRYMFLAGSTLRNFAKDAAAGVAFMNSHRTGGLSHPAELPLGKTFAGRFEETTDGAQRTVLGFYMLRGVAPNGANGPTTDDMHRMIQGGSVAAVSVSVPPPVDELCDVCGAALDSCAHVPGTTHDMTPDEQTAQAARGVHRGRASYSLHEGHLSEVSAVYAGAVPGAGFRKARAFARRRALTPVELAQARTTYASLSVKGEFGMDEIINTIERGFEQLERRFTRREVTPLEPQAPPAELVVGLTPPAPSAAEQQLAAQTTAQAARIAELEARDRQRDATVFADSLVQQNRLLPAQRGYALALYSQALADDSAHGGAVTFSDSTGVSCTGSRAALVAALFGATVPHTLTKEVLQRATTLPGDPTPPPVDAAARRKKLLGQTALGQAALKQTKA